MVSNRQVIWPGSMPADMDERVAWSLLLSELGELLPYVPAPETDKHANWIVPLLEKLRYHPNVEVVKEGDFTGYDRLARYRIKPGQELNSKFIDVGIVNYFKEYVDLFRTMCREFNLPADTPCEISVKGLPDFGLFAFGPRAILTPGARERHVMPFLDATVREMQTVREMAHGLKLLFQIEIPVATIFECTHLGPLHALFDWTARSVGLVAKHVPDGCLTGCHECLGDLGHKAKARPRSAAPVVRLANKIVRHWPDGVRPLEYIHLPLAAGDLAPTVNENFYRPLRDLRVPVSCQVVAGFLHEELFPAEANTILSTVERFVGEARRSTRGGPAPTFRPVAVAPSCGCGRRSEEKTLRVLRQAATLCEPVVAA